jgi:hypothetical protein
MKKTFMALLLIVAIAPVTFAIGDISVGPFYGMAIPVANEAVESGMMYGVQAKVSLVPVLSIGAHYSSRSYGNPTVLVFEGTPLEYEEEYDGGDFTTFGLDAFLGKGGSLPGANFYLCGSFGSYTWKRDGFDNITKTAFAAGAGLEIILPVKVGIEGRALFEFASTGNDATYKSVLWFVGLNYHIGLGPM